MLIAKKTQHHNRKRYIFGVLYWRSIHLKTLKKEKSKLYLFCILSSQSPMQNAIFLTTFFSSTTKHECPARNKGRLTTGLNKCMHW